MIAEPLPTNIHIDLLSSMEILIIWNCTLPEDMHDC